MLELKSEALERFAAGDLDSRAMPTDLLMPLNAARDHIGGLLLHVRDNLEERAQAEGRSVGALWSEEIAEPEKSGERGRMRSVVRRRMARPRDDAVLVARP